MTNRRYDTTNSYWPKCWWSCPKFTGDSSTSNFSHSPSFDGNHRYARDSIRISIIGSHQTFPKLLNRVVFISPYSEPPSWINVLNQRLESTSWISNRGWLNFQSHTVPTIPYAILVAVQPCLQVLPLSHRASVLCHGAMFQQWVNNSRHDWYETAKK